jgi:acyl-CoA reductase-like NAD-dependent aldehyde dehydrogenase
MPAELIAPALASGNTVVWTPASTTAVCATLLAECVVEADLPSGVFNFVTGPGSVVGDEIARNPGTHGVGFIGSTETGRKVELPLNESVRIPIPTEHPGTLHFACGMDMYRGEIEIE